MIAASSISPATIRKSGITSRGETIPLGFPTISNAYLRVQKYNEIFSVLSQYTKGIDIHKDRKYYAVISEAYKNLGEYKKSLEAYEEYIVLSDSIDYAVYTQDTKFVKERHNLELETIKEREAKNRVFLCAAIFIILLITIIIWICARLKVNRMEKAFAEQEMEKYRLMYEQMEEERGLDRSAAIADMRFSFIKKLNDVTSSDACIF